ncbi:MAG TPA: phosphopantetheine-binding protein [Saprospiraceae bacterium]|nr:phosphopantetheine-binding protein [Saprospiraceae bacterium]
MNRKEITDKLYNIARPYVQQKEALEDFSMDTDLLRDLKINSANLIDIVLDVEDEFGVSIENAEMELMINVRSVVELLENKLDAK